MTPHRAPAQPKPTISRSLHWCGVRVNGTAACWSQFTFGSADAPQGRFTTVAPGRFRACGFRRRRRPRGQRTGRPGWDHMKHYDRV